MRRIRFCVCLSVAVSTHCFAQQHTDPSSWRAIPSPALPSHVQAFEFQNAAGELRYVAKSVERGDHVDGKPVASLEFIKLYMSKEDLAADAPTGSFPKSNSFPKSCGPDSVYNLLRWHGVTALDQTISVQSLGDQMKTNCWTLDPSKEWLAINPLSATFFKGSVELTRQLGLFAGTLPQPLTQVARQYTTRHLPGHTFVPLHSDSDEAAFRALRFMLRSGCPVILLYKTGPRGGHFALLVGYEQRATADTFHDDDLFFLANSRKAGKRHEITWKQFKQRWDFSFGPVSPVVREAGGKSRMRFAIVPNSIIANWNPAGRDTAISNGLLFQPR